MNENNTRNALIIAAALTLGYVAVKQTEETCPDCKPPSPVVPAPKTPPPKRPDDPKPKPKPWGTADESRSAFLVGKPVLGGQVGPNGQEVHVDLPLSQRIRNIGSHVDGAGMCVSTSMTHAARWHAMRDWYNWRDWCAKFPGGGYPSKMDKQIKQFSDEKKIPAPPYLQYEGKDPSILEEAFKAGLLPSVTYSGRDGVRYSGSIAHMVNLVYLDDKSAAIMDNNGKPEDLIWMSRDEFIDRWTNGRSGWAHFWLLPGPPPPPRNLSKDEVIAYYQNER